MVKQFYLHCCENSHDPILLPDGVPIKVGRSPETLIQSPKVARYQVQLSADCENGHVSIEQLGINSSFIDRNKLEKGMKTILKVGSVLNILKGKYPHVICPSAEKISKSRELSSSPRNSIETNKKRAMASSNGNISKKSRVEAVEICSTDEETESVKEKLQMMKSKAKHDRSSLTLSSHSPSSSMNSSAVPTSEAKWQTLRENLIIYSSKGVLSSSKIAGFDIDHTIICTKSGKKFPVDMKDWKIMIDCIPTKLKKLESEGYKIVFFTNQNGIAKKKVDVSEFKIKIEEIIKLLAIPIQVFISSGPGKYRKPGFGMWNYLKDDMNDGISISQDDSFYIGDAAGRLDNWAPGRKKDFACSDRLFALNIGIAFHTPEEYFSGYRKAEFKMPEFDPRKLKSDAPLTIPPDVKLFSSQCEVIVCCGFPASGKSTFCKSHFKPNGYVYINRDMLGTWQKCVKLCEESIIKKEKVVIDNTNKDIDSRRRYINICKQYNIPCRCFFFDITFQHIKHNERFREMTDPSHANVNEMILNSFKSNFVTPSLSEGFAEVVKVNFVPKFENEKYEKIYRSFLLEK